MKGYDPKKVTLCLNCKNATRPDKCEWVRDFTPVKKWWAKRTFVSKQSTYKSYKVKNCPKFERDAYDGGHVPVDPLGLEGRTYLDASDVRKLASAICVRAVEDWKYLKYGELVSIPYYGDRIYRDELLEFFFSPYFASLLGSFSQRTPEQVRKLLNITEDMKPEEVKAEK